MLVDRPRALSRIRSSFGVHPAVALTGPRQSGKTTLARMFVHGEPEVTFFDLEKAVDKRRLETPEQTLAPLSGLVVIDEIQQRPRIFETLRVLLDRPDRSTRFLLLASASPALVRGASESLAGRVGLVDLAGLALDEVGHGNWRRLWLRGGFPRSYLAPDDAGSAVWRESFVRTFLERDLPMLGITIAAESLRRFWTMIAHYHGQVWNAAEFGRSLGTSEGTARNYLDLLCGAHVVRALSPWYENLKKRQVKSPKIYVRDSGLLHTLLDLGSFETLSGHPKLGASFEGFVIEQVLASLDTRSGCFWATHGGAELDLMVSVGGKRYGFECKYADAPATTRSMHIAIDDLRLERLWVVYPGGESYDLGERIRVLPVQELPALIDRLAAKKDA